jgi:hypothetical protein
MWLKFHFSGLERYFNDFMWRAVWHLHAETSELRLGDECANRHHYAELDELSNANNPLQQHMLDTKYGIFYLDLEQNNFLE